MDGEEIEAVMERAWDLHDRISDAIHSLSKSHFINSIHKQNSASTPPVHPYNPPSQTKSHFCKEHPNLIDNVQPQQVPHASIPTQIDYLSKEAEDLFAETRSLNAIRNALEALENQLHFLHTLQLQQRAERDAALMRLEESRLMLLKRLRDHRGRELNVIKEALAFATDGDEAEDAHLKPNGVHHSPFGEGNKPLCADKNEKTSENAIEPQNKCRGGLAYFLNFGIRFVKNSDRCHSMAGVVAKLALVAVSMLAIFQLQKTSKRTKNGRSRVRGTQRNTRQDRKHQSETNVQDFFPRNSVHPPGHHSAGSLDVLFGRG